jgi:hypothetical protein
MVDDVTLLDEDCRKDLRCVSPVLIASDSICHSILPPVFVSWANIPSIEMSNSIFVATLDGRRIGVRGAERKSFGEIENYLILEWWCSCHREGLVGQKRLD